MLFSVLMSVYADDNPAFFKRALESIYTDQLLKPGEIVIVCDGPLTVELQAVLDTCSREMCGVLRVITFEQNRGLAWVLNDGLKVCTHDLVARMDADDIALPNRFQRQVEFMKSHPDVDVLGCFLDEIDPSTEMRISSRVVPTVHSDIYKFGITRNPISHPTVMFKRSAVMAVGGYPLFKRSQDYALWSLMLARGYVFANIPEVLLQMRTGVELMQRRGLFYFMQEAKILKFQKTVGFISLPRFVSNVFGRFVLRIAPNSLKSLFYAVAR